jgi:hypothetical protein
MSRYEDGHLEYFKSRGTRNYDISKFQPRAVANRNQTEVSHDTFTGLNQMSMNAFIQNGVSHQPSNASQRFKSQMMRESLSSFKNNGM